MPLQCRSNCKGIWYANYKDVDVMSGGEVYTHYDDPKWLLCKVSPVSGEFSGESSSATWEVFGTNENYVRRMIVSNPNCPIQPNAVVWFGVDPKTGAQHNYIVTKVSQGLFDATVNIRKVPK